MQQNWLSHGYINQLVYTDETAQEESEYSFLIPAPQKDKTHKQFSITL